LNRVFFTTGGGEAVESAWKAAKMYYKLTGRPMKHKVISRSVAYHGTPQGALAITGIPDAKKYFEPLTPGGFRVPNTNFYRAEYHADDIKAFGRWAADRIAEAIEFEGPDTVAAVFLEPVQNSGGCFPPPPGYLERVREICDQYDVLMVADETICAFGRIGDMFAMKRFGVDPDTCTGDHSCIRLSGCPSLSIKPNPDPLRTDPVTAVADSCVGCGLCGEVAHAAVLCPSFYRAEIIDNPSAWDRWLQKVSGRVIGWLQRRIERRLEGIAA
jgi:NAD-dependent dihydropyrimidine dehydrogenase PreA subunit